MPSIKPFLTLKLKVRYPAKSQVIGFSLLLEGGYSNDSNNMKCISKCPHMTTKFGSHVHDPYLQTSDRYSVSVISH